MDPLERMLDLQLEFQKLLNLDPQRMDESEKAGYAKEMILACVKELHEALDEVGWKPWATSRHFNREAFLGELIDAWHFLMNLLLLTGGTPEQVAELLFLKYREKNKINLRRQLEGYDGVSGKCPGCNRAYDDTAVTCHPVDTSVDDYPILPWCEKKGPLG